MDKEQQDYFLRTKVKTIQDRLGDTVSQQKEAEEYREKLKASAIPEEEKGKLEKEIDHLASMPPMMAETAVARNYLDWVFDLPWGKESEDILDLSHAKEILDEDHYGLTKIKERILEYLAVRVLAPDAKAPIICFVGPPGVGKTSLALLLAHKRLPDRGCCGNLVLLKVGLALSYQGKLHYSVVAKVLYLNLVEYLHTICIYLGLIYNPGICNYLLKLRYL